MTTFGIMLDRIEDEIRDTGINTNVRDAIRTSIREYQHERYWFNEDRGLQFITSISQEYYTTTNLASMDNLLNIDSVRITYSGSQYPLRRRQWEWFEYVSSTPSNTGTPTDYTYYQQRMRLYPVPNAALTVDIASVVRFTTLSATTDTNAWMTDGEALIRARAKAHIYAHVKMDDTQAGKFLEIADEERRLLKQETVRRLSSGRAGLWQF